MILQVWRALPDALARFRWRFFGTKDAEQLLIEIPGQWPDETPAEYRARLRRLQREIGEEGK